MNNPRASLRTAVLAAVALTALALRPITSLACTRILSNDSGFGVLSSRTMDWPESTEPKLWILPAGMERYGSRFAGKTVVTENPARWTSRHGSVAVTSYDVGTVDGLNDKGFGVHLLYLNATDFGPRDTMLKGVQTGLWGQYLLDNAATVAEALELMKSLQPVMVEIHGHRATLHMAIQDKTGDSAIVEYVAGKPQIFHGRQYRIMTNDPPDSDQLAFRAQFDFTNATRQTPLPGNVDPTHRFGRADYFREKLPAPKNEREAIAGILAVARSVSVPFGAPNNLPGTLYNTEYRTALDMTHLSYFFELSDAPNVVWLRLSDFNLEPGAPVLALRPGDINLSGNVASSFEPARAPF